MARMTWDQAFKPKKEQTKRNNTINHCVECDEHFEGLGLNCPECGSNDIETIYRADYEHAIHGGLDEDA